MGEGHVFGSGTLTPQMLRAATFAEQGGRYDAAEVREFLERVASSLEVLLADDATAAVREEFRRNAAIAEQVLDAGERAAEQLRRQALDEASAILHDAREAAHELHAAVQVEVDEVRSRAAAVEREREHFIEDLRALYDRIGSSLYRFQRAGDDESARPRAHETGTPQAGAWEPAPPAEAMPADHPQAPPPVAAEQPEPAQEPAHGHQPPPGVELPNGAKPPAWTQLRDAAGAAPQEQPPADAWTTASQSPEPETEPAPEEGAEIEVEADAAPAPVTDAPPTYEQPDVGAAEPAPGVEDEDDHLQPGEPLVDLSGGFGSDAVQEEPAATQEQPQPAAEPQPGAEAQPAPAESSGAGAEDPSEASWLDGAEQPSQETAQPEQPAAEQAPQDEGVAAGADSWLDEGAAAPAPAEAAQPGAAPTAESPATEAAPSTPTETADTAGSDADDDARAEALLQGMGAEQPPAGPAPPGPPDTGPVASAADASADAQAVRQFVLQALAEGHPREAIEQHLRDRMGFIDPTPIVNAAIASAGGAEAGQPPQQG